VRAARRSYLLRAADEAEQARILVR
jgi:hypothetical protein